MKKATIQSLYNFLNGQEIDNLEDVKAELKAEIDRDKAQKEASAKAYEAYHEIVMDALDSAPATLTELWECIEEKILALGGSKGQIQYAITRLWKDEIRKIEGNPNQYCKA